MASEKLMKLIDSFRNGRELFNTSVLFNHVIHAIHNGASKESVIMDVVEAHDQQSEVFKQHLDHNTTVVPKGWMILEEGQTPYKMPHSEEEFKQLDKCYNDIYSLAAGILRKYQNNPCISPSHLLYQWDENRKSIDALYKHIKAK